MLNAPANTARAPDTQRCKSWTDDEIAALKAIADQPVCKAKLAPLFPDRTFGAVKMRMCMVRRELGIKKKRVYSTHTLRPLNHSLPMLDRDEPGLRDDYPKVWRMKAVESNERFLAALQAA